MTLFAVNYDGLRNKGSYEELLARVGSESLEEPDRQAKQIRESPQIANLLDGEGQMSFVQMGKQQLAAATHQQVMQSILQAASAPGAAPAQHLRAAQTRASGAVRVADGEVERSGGAQTDAPQMFDLTADERSEEVRQGLEAEVDQQAQAKAVEEQNIVRLFSANLGNLLGPDQLNLAHEMASSSAAASSENPESPESQHEPKGKPGRPRKVQPAAPGEPPALPSEMIGKEKPKTRAKTAQKAAAP